ncbi:MAG TPA: hypothetical protein VGY54_04755 [Polyangiaceae bacterium]|jgi:hypothetical protein|nr:hypothetical protein [Polyangiaceae bacterium]
MTNEGLTRAKDAGRVFEAVRDIVRDTGRCATADDVSKRLPDVGEVPALLQQLTKQGMMGGPPSLRDHIPGHYVVSQDLEARIPKPIQQVIAARRKDTKAELITGTDPLIAHRLAQARTVLRSKRVTGRSDGATRYFEVALDPTGHARIPMLEVVRIARNEQYADCAKNPSLVEECAGQIKAAELVASASDLLNSVFERGRRVKGEQS